MNKSILKHLAARPSINNNTDWNRYYYSYIYLCVKPNPNIYSRLTPIDILDWVEIRNLSLRKRCLYLPSFILVENEKPDLRNNL